MSSSYISAELRRLVAERADRLCEYCLISEDDTFFGCQVDHIISEKHGGVTVAENLAFACMICNQAKGSDIGSIHRESGVFIRFFNPRHDRWVDHYRLTGPYINGLSQVGEVTARILRFNDWQRVIEREMLQVTSRYPTYDALKRMQ